MKIATNIFDSPSNTGPGNFARRLAQKLETCGVRFIDASLVNEANIYYCSAMFNRTIMHAAKHNHIPCIVRIDGLGVGDDYEKVKEAYVKADHVIFQSEYSKDLFERTHNYVRPNVSVIHNGVEMPQTSAWGTATSNKFITICNTYNAVRWNNHRDAIFNNLDKILEYNPQFKWVIVGKVEGLRFAHTHPAIEFVDYPANLDEIRSNAYAVIHLVQDDSCPNSLIESMAYGIPAITWKESAGPELIGYGRAGVIIDDFDANKLIDAMKNLDKNWIAMSNASYKIVHSNLSIDVCAERYLQCFQKYCSV